MFENRTERNRKSDRQIRRADVYLAGFFLLLALGIFGGSVLGRKDGQTLRISYDGQKLAEIPLSQMRIKNQETAANRNGDVHYCLISYRSGSVSYEWYETKPDLVSAVSGKSSYNLLAVSGAVVSMESSDCPDQICVHHIPISGAGESIICLPHKLVVEITRGTDAEEPHDGITKTGSTDNIAWTEGRRGHETDG